MRGRLGDKVRLMHILDSIAEIESYLLEIDFETFLNNSMMRFACIKHMEIIGEASNHVSNEVKLKFSSVEWLQIVGMRNIFVHEYFGIDANLVWEIIKNDIPELKIRIKDIMESLD
jgi:uncharacterized protein with HEPN domain